MKIQRCKGMRDLSPAEMDTFRFVEGICRDALIKSGYREVRTPTIEYLHLFTSAGTLTPGRLGKVYSFLDWDGWSGERVVLRPDGTIPVARMYSESIRSGVARLFYAANIFIFEETGEKTRERLQCGAELIGAGGAVAEAELVALSLGMLNRLGLKNIELRLSHAGLIKALLGKLGLNPEEQHRTLDLILDGDAEALATISRESPDTAKMVQPLLSLAGQSNEFLRDQKAVLIRNMPEIGGPLDDFLKTVALLDEIGIKYRINIASGAGFEYYTGLIFQLYAGEEKVGGGGRYDALIPSMGGGDVPAAGFALYLDQLMSIVKADAVTPAGAETVQVCPMEDKAFNKAIKEAFKTADDLRKAGYIAEITLDKQKSDSVWFIEVHGNPPALTLINLSNKKEFSISSVAEIVKILNKGK